MMPRADERIVQLGIISIAKVNHEVDPYSRMFEFLTRMGAPGENANSEPLEEFYELCTKA